jgi:hypothetical protein
MGLPAVRASSRRHAVCCAREIDLEVVALFEYTWFKSTSLTS